MSLFEAILLGVVQGLTEFLPISSSGHLRIVSSVFWNEDAGASFTAVTQLGTEAAVLLFFWRDIVRIVKAWFVGLKSKAERGLDYRMGWYVIIATIPIGVLGLLFKDQIRTGARNLYLIAFMLIAFAVVIAIAEKVGRKERPIEKLTTRDGIVIGRDSRQRLFTGRLAAVIRARDGDRCRESYCDAPIRHVDHVRRWADGGRTEFDNGRGLCAFHNHVREVRGWRAEVAARPEMPFV